MMVCDSCPIPIDKARLCYACKKIVTGSTFGEGYVYAMKINYPGGYFMVPFCKKECMNGYTCNLTGEKQKISFCEINYTVGVCPCYKYVDLEVWCEK